MANAKMQFHGVIPAMPTPFLNGKIDLASWDKLLQSLAEAKVHGVVVCGSTGEGPTVSDDEFVTLLKAARKNLPAKIQVLAGTGTNSTASTIERSKLAEKNGAEALLVVTPYYNKPPQEGLYQHYKSVAQATDLPIMLYNVPGRTACNLLPETSARLSEINNIVAIKEASGSLEAAMETKASCTPGFSVLTGEDGIFLPSLAVGCTGIVSVMGNAVPKQMVELYDAWVAKDIIRAQRIAYVLKDFCRLLFIETNPIPLKAALQAQKIFSSAEVRPPLCAMTEKNLAKLQACLRNLTNGVSA